jgi:hypothetical protein
MLTKAQRKSGLRVKTILPQRIITDFLAQSSNNKFVYKKNESVFIYNNGKTTVLDSDVPYLKTLRTKQNHL